VDDSDVGALEREVLRRARALDPTADAIWIDPDLADTATFCARYGHSLDASANCILVRSKTGALRYAACLVQATRRLDLNRRSRALVGARKASFAGREETVEVTGMVPGGVTPIGLPAELAVFVDAPIMQLDRVILGGGGRRLKLVVDPRSLTSLPAVTVADIGRDG
jgi:prolyl-tRNA editing enzyme YbaK/EbsC (Cys-tRNA(Pro) deacylase)